jgi:hypothetical protein
MWSRLSGMWPCGLAGRRQHFGLLGNFHLIGRSGGWRFVRNGCTLLLLCTASHARRLMCYLAIRVARPRVLCKSGFLASGLRFDKGTSGVRRSRTRFSFAGIRFLRTCVSRVVSIRRVHSNVEFDIIFSLPERLLILAITRIVWWKVHVSRRHLN